MQRVFFDGEIERLNQQFPRWVVTGEMRDRLFMALNHVPAKTFTRIVDDIMLNVTSTKVTKNHFEERIHLFGGDARDIRKTETSYFEDFKNLRPCKHCGVSGYVFAKQEGDLQTTAFKCFCSHGQMRKDNWEIWGSRFTDIGFKNTRLE